MKIGDILYSYVRPHLEVGCAQCCVKKAELSVVISKT